jgi:hypothetical protein
MVDTGILRKIDSKRRVAIPQQLCSLSTRYQIEHYEATGIVKLVPVLPGATGVNFVLLTDGWLTFNRHFTLYLGQQHINAFHIYTEGATIILKGIYMEKDSLLMTKDRMPKIKGVQCDNEMCAHNSNGGCVADRISLRTVPYNNGFIVCCEIASNQTLKN